MTVVVVAVVVVVVVVAFLTLSRRPKYGPGKIQIYHETEKTKLCGCVCAPPSVCLCLRQCIFACAFDLRLCALATLYRLPDHSGRR